MEPALKTDSLGVGLGGGLERSGLPLSHSELNHEAETRAGAEELELRAEERRLSRAPWWQPIENVEPVSLEARALARLDFREAIAQAFEGIGGVASLIEWARRNPGVFYTKVWSPLSRSVLVAGSMRPDGAGGHQFVLGLSMNDEPPSEAEERQGAAVVAKLEAQG